MLLFQSGDFVLIEEGEVFEVTNDITVIGPNPELVEAVRAGAAGIEPDSALLSLTEFGAIGPRDEGEGEAVRGAAEFFAAKFDAGGDVAPLIAAADLQFALVVPAEHIKIECLEQHVTELGVADADLAVFHSGAHAFLLDHLIDGEMLADVAEEIEASHVFRPGSVIHEPRRVRFCVEIEQPTQLLLHAGDVRRDRLLREQVALGGFATRIANGPGRAACNCDRMMAKQLKPSQAKQWNEVANVQAVSGRIEAAIKNDWRSLQPIGKNELSVQILWSNQSSVPVFNSGRRIGNQPAPFQLVQDVHSWQRLWGLAGRFTRARAMATRCFWPPDN